MTLSRTTKDHDEIRKWAESRGAVPAEVASTEQQGEPGILRFEFPKAPNHNDSKLKEISWDDFFEKFDENDLELVYQEKTAEGQKSNFNKLVHPSSDEHSSRSSSRSGSHSSSSQSGRSNKSASEDENERSTLRGSKSHASSTGTSHSGSKASATDMEDEDLDDDEELGDDFEEVAGADNLDDNGEPRRSSESSGKSGKSNKSSGSHSGSGSSSSGSSSKSSGTKQSSSTSKKK